LGTRFIATAESNAAAGYKQMVVDSSAEEIVYTSLFSGVAANFLRDSVKRTGLDPDNLPAADKAKMDFSAGSHEFKAWRDVWSAGQSVSGVREVSPVAELVERMAAEYETARARLAPQAS
jgi:nitronate monooxygenase